MAHVFHGKLYFTRDHMQGSFICKNLKLAQPKPSPKPQAKASSKASSSGEHVQLFRMMYDRKKGFQACRLLMLIACENMGVNLNFHVSNTFLCLHAFGNMGGG